MSPVTPSLFDREALGIGYNTCLVHGVACTFLKIISCKMPVFTGKILKGFPRSWMFWCFLLLFSYCKFFADIVLTVVVKWGKEKFENVELNSDESPELFKAQLFALSGVAPERQKVMYKGSVLKVCRSTSDAALSAV